MDCTLKDDEFHTRNDEIYAKNDEIYAKNDGFCEQRPQRRRGCRCVIVPAKPPVLSIESARNSVEFKPVFSMFRLKVRETHGEYRSYIIIYNNIDKDQQTAKEQDRYLK